MIGEIGDKAKSIVKGFFCIPDIESKVIGDHIRNIESSLMSSPCERIASNQFKDNPDVIELRKS